MSNENLIELNKLFKKGKVIGIGGFGKVWNVNHIYTQKAYAMKEMSKIKVVSKKSATSVINERNLLANLTNDFIINMHHAFQNNDNLYLTMDLVTGGDLRLHISRKRFFSEEEVRFMAACLVLALEYLNENNIIHRDIKPENILVDHNGYIRLTDLGIARFWTKDNAADTSGTPGYMSPEVMCCYNHDFRVDYYALGVICYEMISGKRPYNGANRKEIRAEILSRQEYIRNVPKGFSSRAVDFTNRCILRKPGQRLGKEGIVELKNHEWFHDFDWNSLNNMKMKSPLKPMTLDNIDYNINKTTFDYENYDRELCSEEHLIKYFLGYDYQTELIVKSSNTESTRITTLSEISVTSKNNVLNYSKPNPNHKFEIDLSLRKDNPNNTNIKMFSPKKYESLKPLNMSNYKFNDTDVKNGVHFMTPPGNFKSGHKYKLDPIDMSQNSYRQNNNNNNRYKDKINSSIDTSQIIDYSNKKSYREKYMNMNFENTIISNYNINKMNLANETYRSNNKIEDSKINFEFQQNNIKSKDKLPKIKVNKDKSKTSPRNNKNNKYLMFIK